jgi:hypothetical protein
VPGNNMKPYSGLASTESKSHRFLAISLDGSTVNQPTMQNVSERCMRF